MIQAYDLLISIYKCVHMYIKIRPPNPKSSFSTNTVRFIGHATRSDFLAQLNWFVFLNSHALKTNKRIKARCRSFESDCIFISNLAISDKTGNLRKNMPVFMWHIFRHRTQTIAQNSTFQNVCSFFEAWGLKPVNFIRELQTHNIEYFFRILGKFNHVTIFNFLHKSIVICSSFLRYKYYVTITSWLWRNLEIKIIEFVFWNNHLAGF